MKTITITIQLSDSQFSQLENHLKEEDLSVEGWADEVMTASLLSSDVVTSTPEELYFNEVKVKVS